MTKAPQASPHRLRQREGGTGKSTPAVHIAVALAYRGAEVAAIDLDPRQSHALPVFRERAADGARRGIDLPTARFEVFEGGRIDELERWPRTHARLAISWCTTPPAAAEPLARHAATEADTLVTPMNDSFVDFD